MSLGSERLQRALELLDAPKRRRERGNFLHHVDVLDFLETLEVESLHKATADEWQFRCPFDGHTSGDANPSAYMNDGSKDKTKTTLWKCHGCSRSGNAVSFYAELESITKQQASQHIRETWAANYRAPKGGSIAAEFELRLVDKWERDHARDIVKNINQIHYDDLFGVDWEVSYQRYQKWQIDDPAEIYLFARGFDAATLTRWNIGYDPLTERFTIPINDADGNLIGVKARAWSDDVKPKYIILGDKTNRRPRYGFMPYEKSRVVFGLDRVIASGGKRAVLDEGELNVLAFDQIGYPAISTGSAHVSIDQAKLIRDHIDELVVCFDPDAAGYNATWGWADKDGEWHPGLVERLAPFLHLRVVSDHDHDASKNLELGQIQAVVDLIETAKFPLRLPT